MPCFIIFPDRYQAFSIIAEFAILSLTHANSLEFTPRAKNTKNDLPTWNFALKMVRNFTLAYRFEGVQYIPTYVSTHKYQFYNWVWFQIDINLFEISFKKCWGKNCQSLTLSNHSPLYEFQLQVACQSIVRNSWELFKSLACIWSIEICTNLA